MHACINEPIKLLPGHRKLVQTGIAIALPDGYEAQVRARSGLAYKYGISLVNGVGTIDADYRGEVGVLLINLGHREFTIEPKMRVAQLVISKYEKIQWNELSTLEESARGDFGFGSTGS